MSRILIALAAVLTLAVVATPADAVHPFRRQVVVQRQVIRQPVVRQQVIVQKVVQQPVVQAVYAQPLIVQQQVQSVCYPQASIVAPVYSQQVVGGSACFFAR